MSRYTAPSLTLGFIDIQCAYLQRGPINMKLYIRSSREPFQRRVNLWRLIMLQYDVCEAGCQWAEMIENWSVGEVGLHCAYAVSHPYIRCHPDGTIRVYLAKLTNDLLLAGTDQ